VEPATVCALVVATGRRLYCKVLDVRGWGAGHASIAVAGDVALQVYEADPEGWGGLPDGRLVALARRVIGLPPKRQRAPPPGVLREQVMVAFGLEDGLERWRVGLGRGTRRVPGHIAGTPAIAGGVAYVPSPTSGSVVAVEVAAGRVIWSSPVLPARGSVLVSGGKVFAATASGTVVLDARTGAVLCRQALPAAADRAGPSVLGGTGVLTLLDGTVMARPLDAWLSCTA
jgi:outer membrane protein assembly factor BamB